MEHEPFILAGYMAKRPARASADLGLPPHVREIGSVSGCLSNEPDGWIERWRHNELFLFDSPDLATSVIAEPDRSSFDVYAYKILPRLFGEPGAEDWALPELRVAPLPEDYRRLGWDLVSRWAGSSFECSPLSCNGIAKEVSVNEHCLLGSLEEALAIVSTPLIQSAEPGPYVVVEVWRRN